METQCHSGPEPTQLNSVIPVSEPRGLGLGSSECSRVRSILASWYLNLQHLLATLTGQNFVHKLLNKRLVNHEFPPKSHCHWRELSTNPLPPCERITLKPGLFPSKEAGSHVTAGSSSAHRPQRQRVKRLRLTLTESLRW